jgi:hypothetical protein
MDESREKWTDARDFPVGSKSVAIPIPRQKNGRISERFLKNCTLSVRNPAKSIKVGRAGKPIKPNNNAQTTHYEQDGGQGGIASAMLRPS